MSPEPFPRGCDVVLVAPRVASGLTIHGSQAEFQGPRHRPARWEVVLAVTRARWRSGTRGGGQRGGVGALRPLKILPGLEELSLLNRSASPALDRRRMAAPRVKSNASNIMRTNGANLGVRGIKLAGF